jgi:hypothetical protein
LEKDYVYGRSPAGKVPVYSIATHLSQTPLPRESEFRVRPSVSHAVLYAPPAAR